MKVLPFTIPKSKADLIILQKDEGLAFYDQLHQHEQFQLSYIVNGEGTLIVGDSVSSYKSGDVLILGENLPHVFKSDTSKNVKSKMLSVFFTKHSFGLDFFEIEELRSLRSFFKKAEAGFRIKTGNKEAAATFQRLNEVSKFERFILFLELLRQLNKSKHEQLSSFVTAKKYKDVEGQRMNAVFEYSISNFHKSISLEEIAHEAAMTKNAFCKYFKKRTNKTYITFLNELRIEEACKLMNGNRELNIAEIAERSGYRNISNFNRKFKQVKNKTPRDYKKELGL